jgi:hypothetical protein
VELHLQPLKHVQTVLLDTALLRAEYVESALRGIIALEVWQWHALLEKLLQVDLPLQPLTHVQTVLLDTALLRAEYVESALRGIIALKVWQLFPVKLEKAL